MKNKYAKLDKVHLNEVEVFFSSPLKKIIAQMNATTLGQLLEISETKEFIQYFIYADSANLSPLYQELLGTLKLLKYKYLDINPNFNEKCSLQELGFSAKAISGIIRFKSPIIPKGREGFYEESDIVKLIEFLNDENILNREFTKVRAVGAVTVNEVRSKVQILSKYFKEKMLKTQISSSSVEEVMSNGSLVDLYMQLEELLQKQYVLGQQILIVRNKIMEVMKVEGKNGTTKK